ncbi:hypothetical protein [Pseudomonas putida]
MFQPMFCGRNPASPYRLLQIRMHRVEAGLQRIDQRDVRAVLPAARQPVRFHAVLMPGASRGEHEVVGAEASSPGCMTCRPEYNQPTGADTSVRRGLFRLITCRPAFSGEEFDGAQHDFPQVLVAPDHR